MFPFRQRIERLLDRADIRIDGARSQDIRVHDPRFYRHVVLQGSLGLGESYMAGWWDCERLDEFFVRLLYSGVADAAADWHALLLDIRNRLFNLQSRTGAYVIGKRHYDLGDELFEHMLDSRMIYSCAYWLNADDLETAQRAKLDLVARKLGLQSGMRVLDVGCGWGGAARYLAEMYGVEVVGVTVSAHQAERARKWCADFPVEILLEDYRELPKQYGGYFDRALSIGMFEHVGYRNYRKYFTVLRQCLKPDGLFLLHSIGRNRSRTYTDPWISRYIFPRSNLPSIAQIGNASEELFVMEDWHNFGADYDRTLMAWLDNFERSFHELPARYDERFRRMWRYFLASSAGGFRIRYLQLWQLVLSPHGVPDGYFAPR